MTSTLQSVILINERSEFRLCLSVCLCRLKNGGHFVGLLAVTVKRLHRFSRNLDYLCTFIDRSNLGLRFALSVRNFVCLCVCLSISRLQQHTFTECHEIWNQRTWHKDGATYIRGFCISLPFQNGGRFGGLFRNYGVERDLIFTLLIVYSVLNMIRRTLTRGLCT